MNTSSRQLCSTAVCPELSKCLNPLVRWMNGCKKHSFTIPLLTESSIHNKVNNFYLPLGQCGSTACESNQAEFERMEEVEHCQRKILFTKFGLVKYGNRLFGLHKKNRGWKFKSGVKLILQKQNCSNLKPLSECCCTATVPLLPAT